MWDYTDGCAKQYHCTYDIYLLSCIDLEFCIIIEREIGAPGHEKYVDDSLNSRDKQMIKLEMENILNPELICGDPNFPSSCRFTKMNKTKL